jgi:hypothetical protein
MHESTIKIIAFNTGRLPDIRFNFTLLKDRYRDMYSVIDSMAILEYAKACAQRNKQYYNAFLIDLDG